MAKIDWVHERLNLWAEWIIRGKCSKSLGYGGNSFGDEWDAPNNREPRAIIPLDDEECGQTDAAVHALPEELCRLVHEYYLNGSQAVRDRLGLSASSLSQRLSHAHQRLAAILEEQKRSKRRFAPAPKSIVEDWADPKGSHHL